MFNHDPLCEPDDVSGEVTPFACWYDGYPTAGCRKLFQCFTPHTRFIHAYILLTWSLKHYVVSVHLALHPAITRAAGCVIVLEYDFGDKEEEDFFAALASIYGEFLSSNRRKLREKQQCHNSDNQIGKNGSQWEGRVGESSKSMQSPSPLSPPLLILLAMDVSFESTEKQVLIDTAVGNNSSTLTILIHLVKCTFLTPTLT